MGGGDDGGREESYERRYDGGQGDDVVIEMRWTRTDWIDAECRCIGQSRPLARRIALFTDTLRRDFVQDTEHMSTLETQSD